MRPFAYVKPRSLEETLRLLSAHGPEARVLAGGTDVIVRLRLGHMRPSLIVDVKAVAEIGADITEVDSCLRVGARVVMTQILRDERMRRHFCALVEAAAVVGSVQIRNRATLAGNICNASPAADTAPALLVYGAIVNLIGDSGARRVPVTEFFTGPGRTVLRTGEIVQSIDLPLPAHPIGAAFGRVTRRYGVDLATINLCCLVSAAGDVRFAYGAVGPRPFLVRDESGVLADRSATAETRTAAIDRLIGHASPISDVRGSRDYRRAMLHVMSHRALQAATARLHTGQAGA